MSLDFVVPMKEPTKAEREMFATLWILIKFVVLAGALLVRVITIFGIILAWSIVGIISTSSLSIKFSD